jgi:uncharacterized coiled-coil protein SlyX
MNPDDEAPLTLTKWPFYISDALLVGIAITIAFLDNWKLDGIQVFACVLAVALGAAFLVWPFVTEYLMQVREENEDHASEDRLLKKQLENTEATLLKQQERLKRLESRSNLDDQRYELLTSAIDQKTQVELPDLTALTERIEAIETSGTKQAKLVDAFRKEVTDFEKNFKETVDSLSALKARMDYLEKAYQESSFNSTEEKPEESSDDNMSRKRSKKSDSSLLQRAIQEKQDAASTAVNRIIDPSNQPATSDRKTKTAGTSNHENEAEVSEVETEVSKDTKTEVAEKEISDQIEALPEDFSVSLDADLMLDDDFFESERTTGFKKSNPQKAKKSVLSATAPETAAPNNEETAAASEKTTAASVTVNKLMGIGNKPFLRGSGAGLSWEKGVEMEFQEIGKWTWSAPEDLNEHIEIQVYRNDEDIDRKGKYTLQPGQQLKLTPEF